MADQAANAVKDTVQTVTDKVSEMSTADSAGPATHLDEVTGEQVSKSELKKRQKQREKDAKKAEKAATAKPQAQPKRKAAQEEEAELTPNVSVDSIGSCCNGIRIAWTG